MHMFLQHHAQLTAESLFLQLDVLEAMVGSSLLQDLQSTHINLRTHWNLGYMGIGIIMLLHWCLNGFTHSDALYSFDYLLMHFPLIILVHIESDCECLTTTIGQ